MRVHSIFLPATLGFVLVAACGSDDGGAAQKNDVETAAEKLCKQIASYGSECASSAGPCDNALVADCGSVVGVLSDGFLNAVSGCLASSPGTSPFACFTSTLTTLAPAASQTELIAGICTTCTDIPLVPDEIAATCQSAFVQGFDIPSVSGGDPTHVNLGALFAAVGDEFAQTLQTECVTGPLDCVPTTFMGCAQRVLVERAFPQNTVDCLLNSMLSGGIPTPSAPCVIGGGGASTTGAAGGAGGGSTSSTTASVGSSSGSGAQCQSDTDCSQGETCVAGVCTSTSSSGSGGSTCDGGGSCWDSCFSCAVIYDCNDEWNACTGECNILANCTLFCEDIACVDACYEAHPAGQSLYSAWETCFVCQQCPSDCSALTTYCP